MCTDATSFGADATTAGTNNARTTSRARITEGSGRLVSRSA